MIRSRFTPEECTLPTDRIHIQCYAQGRKDGCSLCRSSNEPDFTVEFRDGAYAVPSRPDHCGCIAFTSSLPQRILPSFQTTFSDASVHYYSLVQVASLVRPNLIDVGRTKELINAFRNHLADGRYLRPIVNNKGNKESSHTSGPVMGESRSYAKPPT